jgi:hypothetical protein
MSDKAPAQRVFIGPLSLTTYHPSLEMTTVPFMMWSRGVSG